MNEVLFPEIEIATLQEPLEWVAFFLPGTPIEIEIGIGKGRFLLDQAAEHPERGYLGVEYARKYLRLAKERAEKRGLENVRFAYGHALDLFTRWLPPESIEVLHLYFPDPWPKNRHHRRRLVQEPFIAQAHRVLKPGGLWHAATDHEDYYHWIRERLDGREGFQLIQEETYTEGQGATNFEIKYLREGRKIHRVSYRKI